MNILLHQSNKREIGTGIILLTVYETEILCNLHRGWIDEMCKGSTNFAAGLCKAIDWSTSTCKLNCAILHFVEHQTYLELVLYCRIFAVFNRKRFQSGKQSKIVPSISFESIWLLLFHMANKFLFFLYVQRSMWKRRTIFKELVINCSFTNLVDESFVNRLKNMMIILILCTGDPLDMTDVYGHSRCIQRSYQMLSTQETNRSPRHAQSGVGYARGKKLSTCSRDWRGIIKTLLFSRYIMIVQQAEQCETQLNAGLSKQSWT